MELAHNDFNNLSDFWKRQLGLFLVKQSIFCNVFIVFCKQAGVNVRVETHGAQMCMHFSWAAWMSHRYMQDSPQYINNLFAISQCAVTQSCVRVLFERFVISGSKQNILLLSLMTSHGEVTGRCRCFVIGHKWALWTFSGLSRSSYHMCYSRIIFSSSYEWNDHIKDHL